MEREQDDLVRLKLEWAEFQGKIQVDVKQMQDRKSLLQE